MSVCIVIIVAMVMLFKNFRPYEIFITVCCFYFRFFFHSSLSIY
jgi:hypothetical protein